MQCSFSASRCTVREIFLKFQMKTHHKINTSLLMLREWTYTALSRDALGNKSPSALEISLGRGFCTPRPSGFALGKSLGPRGAKSTPLGNFSGLGGCISQYIPPLGSVRIQYHHYNRYQFLSNFRFHPRTWGLKILNFIRGQKQSI